MRYLYHDWVSPGSRLIRLLLSEKKLKFTLYAEAFWQHRTSFLRLTPEGQIPLLIEGVSFDPVTANHAPGSELPGSELPGSELFEQKLFVISQQIEIDHTISFPTTSNGFVIAGTEVILDYLACQYPERSLLSENVLVRLEVIRLVTYFQTSFCRDVVTPLVHEKIIKRLYTAEATDSIALRTAKQNIDPYLSYLDWLVQRRHWVAGNALSLADLAAGASISCLDYLAEINWSNYPEARNWYRRLKSRPSFHPILQDSLSGVRPPEWYANPDF